MLPAENPRAIACLKGVAWADVNRRYEEGRREAAIRPRRSKALQLKLLLLLPLPLVDSAGLALPWNCSFNRAPLPASSAVVYGVRYLSHRRRSEGAATPVASCGCGCLNGSSATYRLM